MPTGKKTKRKAEFGDFQTPLALARAVCRVLSRHGVKPSCVLEPTCGTGSFLLAAIETFTTVSRAVGVEINPSYVSTARSLIREHAHADKVEIVQADFFTTDWPALLGALEGSILVVGNPPWVTNAELGVLGSSNLPKKTNFQKHNGLDAMTGKSNFDISEWMLIHLLEWLNGRSAMLAVLCKTAVARKVLLYAWKNGISLKASELRGIDATESFGASVDACLLVCTLAPSSRNLESAVFAHLEDIDSRGVVGFRDGRLVADVEAYEQWKHLQGGGGPYRWRSGIKHDCIRVMEFIREGGHYRNGLGELVELEDDYLYPMLKSSELANGLTKVPRRWMLVTQRAVGEETTGIKTRAPRTWDYLLSHADRLDSRISSVYRKRPRFSVFGVGDYSFAPWKVAISGFYKKLRFSEVGSFKGKPIVLDDTSNFIACRTKKEAHYIASLLNCQISQEFYSAFAFWDNKRPITIDMLRRLDLVALASELGSESIIRQFMARHRETKHAHGSDKSRQKVLFP